MKWECSQKNIRPEKGKKKQWDEKKKDEEEA